jgi:hypothetical protein
MKIYSIKSKKITVIFLTFLIWFSIIFPAHADTPTTTPMPDPKASNLGVFLPVIVKPLQVTLPPNPTSTPPSNPMVYYISPSGNDNNSGLSASQPWGTFNHAWKYLYPGDTLVLLDGVYHQTLNPNVRNGQPGNPITVRAQNDGKAIIEGDHQRITVRLGQTWTGEPGQNPVGNYFVVEGIIAQNSSGTVYDISGSHNILSRVSGYNADTDTNNHVFVIDSSEYNIIEDCIAGGTGRKMMLIFKAKDNIIRRCFTKWLQWDGRNFGVCWPWGDGIEIYNSDDNIIENSIAYARNPTWQISLLAQGGSHSDGNQILGTMAIRSGMKEDGTPMVWGTTRPQPTSETCIRDFNWPGQRDGFNVWESGGEVKDNLWQDIFAWGSAGLGISWEAYQNGYPTTGNNRINRATFFNNGLDNPCPGSPCPFGGVDTDSLQVDLNRFTSITNSKIDKIFISWPNYPTGPRNLTSMNGEGARLINRYVDGVLTNEPLWPWPMEGRVKNELGISVTNLMTPIIFGTSNLSQIYH